MAPKSTAAPPALLSSKRFDPWFGDADIVERALWGLSIDGNLRLVGETGAGKSTLVETLDHASRQESEWRKPILAEYAKKGLSEEWWAARNGIPWHLRQYSLTQDTSRWDLAATQTLVAGSVRITPGPILEWLEDETPNTRKVLFLDEWNYAGPGVTALFNQLADFRRSIRVSEIAIYDQMTVEAGKSERPKDQWGIRTRTEDHWLIVAENPYDVTNYSGTNPPNLAQVGRFFPVEVPYLTQNDEINLLMRTVKNDETLRAAIVEIVGIARQLRLKYKAHELGFVLSPRNTKSLALLYKETKDMDKVYATIKDWFPEANKRLLSSLEVLKSRKAR